jgi:hypothetical protein
MISFIFFIFLTLAAAISMVSVDEAQAWYSPYPQESSVWLRRP